MQNINKIKFLKRIIKLNKKNEKKLIFKMITYKHYLLWQKKKILPSNPPIRL